jgi:hypothetical protein
MHTFTVDLESCGECHSDEMHYYVSKAASPDDPEQAGIAFRMEDVMLQSEPDPVSPMGFAILAGLVGMASGMVIAPWLERWYRHINP